jgi:hypothetical protein
VGGSDGRVFKEKNGMSDDGINWPTMLVGEIRTREDADTMADTLAHCFQRARWHWGMRDSKVPDVFAIAGSIWNLFLNVVEDRDEDGAKAASGGLMVSRESGRNILYADSRLAEYLHYQHPPTLPLVKRPAPQNPQPTETQQKEESQP